MLVSWNWLRDYVPLKVTPQEFADRLMMAGLNHESTESYGGDFAIDLEVTSNRPDCLGHLGIAREAALLFDTPLQIPDPRPAESGMPVDSLARVEIDSMELCPQYSARVIRGIRVGPSPTWLAVRLQALGIALVNNIVDVTNYVLMECSQPLHAFDYDALRDHKIVVRAAKAGENLVAIDHKTYGLDPSMCVIADAERPVALAGVMGGADTEVSASTTNVLVESAEFRSLSVRSTARKLKLHSSASYRFERGVDAAGIDWASRRCCELILQTAGGELAKGVAFAGQDFSPKPPIVLRLSQIPRILGIDVSADRVAQILSGLGCSSLKRESTTVTVTAPSWRRDLLREIDLIEEVARVHGYDKIPEDTQVPMVSSFRSDADRVQSKIRGVLTAAGLDEALTLSMVTRAMAEQFSPWTNVSSLVAETPILEGADHLRRSLIPSLLAARLYNESKQNPAADLFELAKIYLARPTGLPQEQLTLGIVTGGDLFFAKGLVEAIRRALHLNADPLEEPLSIDFLDINRSCRYVLQDKPLAYVGELSQSGCRQLGLRSRTSVIELNVELMAQLAQLIPQQKVLSNFPYVSRDLNLVVDEAVRWTDLSATVRSAAGPLLEELEYKEVYRDPSKDGAAKKRLLFSVTLRSTERTLTNEEADNVRGAIVTAANKAHGARLLDS